MFFICKQCGDEFEGKPGETVRLFCSGKCFHDFRRQESKHTCPNNHHVICTDRYYCYKCGWNPEVEKRRKEAMV